MTAKISPARRLAFLQALEASGNLSLSAERAKVSRSWVRLHRGRDPAFDAECRAALAAAKARLGEASGRAPPEGWGFLDGEELVVKGVGGSRGAGAAGTAAEAETGVRIPTPGTGGKRVQIARARIRQWSPRVEDRFLATLAATCNVKAACAEVGMTAASAYAHRKRWRAFAERWQEALETGYARLEFALLENGANLFSAAEMPPEVPMRGMTVDHAIHLLHTHKHAVRGLQTKRWARRPSLDAVRASIERKVNAILGARRLEGRG